MKHKQTHSNKVSKAAAILCALGMVRGAKYKVEGRPAMLELNYLPDEKLIKFSYEMEFDSNLKDVGVSLLLQSK